MASLFKYVLLWGSIHIVLGTPTLDFYLPSSQSPNVLRLECINGGQADPSARFEFQNSMGVFLRDLPTDTNENYRTYDITADSEAVIRCVVGEGRSEAVVFAGIFNYYSNIGSNY